MTSLRLPLTISDILRIVPHRHPFLMIDRVVDLEPGRRVRAYKNVSIGDALGVSPLTGGRVLPQLMVIEAIGQAALVLVAYARENTDRLIPLFVGCDYEFHSEVEPGCRLDVEAEIEKSVSAAAIITGRAFVGSRPIAGIRATAALLQPSDDKRPDVWSEQNDGSA